MAQAEVVTPVGDETFREVAKEDRAFLNQMESTPPQPEQKSVEAEPKMSQPAPKKVVRKTKRSGSAQSTGSARKAARKQASKPAVKPERAKPVRKVSVVETRVGPPLISREEVGDFVADYLRSMESSSLQDEAEFYADRVYYLGKGAVPKERLLDQQAKQREQWPDRSLYLESRPEVRYLREDEALVTFRKSFLFENDEQEIEGENITQLRLKTSSAGTKIVAIQELQ